MGDVGWVPSGRKTRVRRHQPRVDPSFSGLALTLTVEEAVAVAVEDVAPPAEVEAA
jgi:hypothetical protein